MNSAASMFNTSSIARMEVLLAEIAHEAMRGELSCRTRLPLSESNKIELRTLGYKVSSVGGTDYILISWDLTAEAEAEENIITIDQKDSEDVN